MSNKNLHEGHRARLKGRFVKDGLDGFEEHNVLELMLFYGIPYKDTNNIAHRLIEKFGSFERVLEADIESLREVDGIGENTAVMLKLFQAVTKYYDEKKHQLQVKLSNPEDIVNFVRAHCRYRAEEVFTVFALDGDCKYLAHEDISTGSLNMTEVSTRKAVDFVLRSKAACAIITHNHPSGIALPSAQDIEVTKMVADALSAIPVSLVDHIIIADNDYVSMAQSSKYSHLFK